MLPVVVAVRCIKNQAKENFMQYFGQLKLSGSVRPTTQVDGIAFIEQYIFPTLELCKKLQQEKKIIAGGPQSGTVALALIVNAESERELDDLITSLPVWPHMETEVTPLTSFDGRMQSLLPRLENLKVRVRGIGMSAPGGGR
jgi:muconolactone delta-isomerase